MQVFAPFDNFCETAKSLDMRRLGKQRVECYQLLKINYGLTTAWSHHPVSKMWRSYSHFLSLYAFAICDEWIVRGYKDSVSSKISGLFMEHKPIYVKPPWWTDYSYHRSHRSNLSRKNPEHYSKFWYEPDNLPYIYYE